jgi:hypothetical protein
MTSCITLLYTVVLYKLGVFVLSLQDRRGQLLRRTVIDTNCLLLYIILSTVPDICFSNLAVIFVQSHVNV